MVYLILDSKVVSLIYKLLPNWSSSLTAFALDMLPSKLPWSMNRSSKTIPSFLPEAFQKLGHLASIVR